MSVYDTCESVFATLGLSYDLGSYQHGTNDLPATFFIYRIVSDVDVAFYNNASARRAYRVQINLYMQNKADLKTRPDALDTALIAAGWLPQGSGRDVDQLSTGHWGWSKDYLIPTER